MSDLLIKINADAANAVKEFDNMREETEDLEGVLNKVALVSGIAFAALTATVYSSVKAFEEAQASSIELTNALQNQGIYTKELTNDYKDYATAVQAATGIDDDAVTKAQAVAQTYLGQTKITKELTFAIADLGQTMGGDLNGAAEKIARTIGTSTNAFAKQGLQLDDTATTAERYGKVLEFVGAKAGGLAAEFNKADGYTRALATAFGNFQEEIGSRFAPIIAAARQAVAGFFEALSNNPVLLDIIASLITAGVVVTGLVTAVAAAIPVFLALKAAMVAFGIASNIAFAGIPAAIGLVVAAVTFMALNWTETLNAMKSLATGVVSYISELFAGVGQILRGAFNFDIEGIKAGLKQIKDAYGKAEEDAIAVNFALTESQKEEGQKQDANRKALADKQAADERQHQANLRAIRTAEIELMKLQNENASAELIALKTKEIEVLKALDQQKSEEELTLLRERRDKILALEDEQKAEDLERQKAFAQLQADTAAELDALKIENAAQLRESQIAQLQAQAQTENDIDRQVQTEILQRRIAARNQELLDRKKYGEAVAVINKAISSDEVKSAKDAASDLVQLSQSKNQTLKEIGKAAAVADITISTAQAAMRIYTGFATIPIIGPALGVAGAAAAIAFGAERIGQVTSAADGGEITGGIAGKDSVPALLMPGELVVPKRNFNQVVNAVQNEGGGSSEQVQLLRDISDKLNNSGTQVTINGDMLTDETFVDRLITKISDGIEFRNGKIFGVTT